MRFIIIIVLGLLMISPAVKAQVFPDFGEPSKEELEMSTCAFEPNAAAVVLLHEANTSYDYVYSLVTVHHIRIKILKDAGLPYATVGIRFFSDKDIERIEDVEAVVINKGADGELVTQQVDKKSFYKQKTTRNFYELKFTFPSVKVGSIIEYQYKSILPHYGFLVRWIFQDEIPVLISRYHLKMHPEAEFSFTIQQTPPNEAEVRRFSDSGTIEFEMKNVRSLGKEPYMDKRSDFLQRVDFRLYGVLSGLTKKVYNSTWEQTIWPLLYDENFGRQLKFNVPNTRDFIEEARKIVNKEERLKYVYEYVRQNMLWNEYDSKFSYDGIRSAWRDKKGSTADISLILVNLLQSADLEAYPLLVSDRDNGKVNEMLPSIGQFNKCLAVATINGKNFYLDATDKHIRYDLVPPTILNTMALVVKEKGGLIKIEDLSSTYKRAGSVTAKLDNDSRLSGSVLLSYSDYARADRLADYKDSAAYLESFKHYAPNTTIENFEAVNEEYDSLPFLNKFKFSAPANSSGEYTFINLNIFTGLQSNPFVSDTRVSDINFGWKRFLSTTIVLDIADNYTIDVLPKSIQLSDSDKSMLFTRQVVKDESSKKIMVKIRLETFSSYYAADSYSDIQTFYKKMFDLLNEPIVLKK